jgi:aminomethyltransferase
MNTLRTPLFDEHVRLGAKMAPFGGWDMPIQYEGILAEHEATRTRCGMFDICHMGEFELSGPTATEDLERLLTQSVATLNEGRCRYGYLLRDDGGVLDDLTCYRFGPERYWLIVNAATRERDAAWIRERCSPGTTFTDLSDGLAKIDVQGPTSRQDLEQAVGCNLPDLAYFGFAEVELLGAACVVSRTGYTGEWGYELYFPADHAVRFWQTFLEAGIKPAGLGARDTLRLEVGYPLYGHELTEDRSPVGAARGAFIQRDKEFIGRDRVLRDLESGPDGVLVGIALTSKRAARAGDRIWVGDRDIGVVTSGSLAPSLGYAVALAYVAADVDQAGTAVEVMVRGSRLPGQVVDLPFYRNGTARRKRAGG